MNSIGLKHLVIATLVMGFATAASAQYVWLNENGVKQYSDAPPPNTVPRNRILKEPGLRAKPSMESGTESGKSAAPETSAAPMSVAEKNADFMKRKQEQAKKEAKAADDERLASEKAKNCDKAKNYQRTLESGQRIGELDKNGERSFMSDGQRAKELQEVKSHIEKCN